ncbi:MAG: substrate-binding domain-containing protein [Verrucomicrobiota bacterium]|nr:substrate-binding domain-containing protein [Verrucomicrobiota bacterium]MDI9382809.1 substrate-binding domain-containing protein [Verrucomicrobiota bacterium]
MKRFRWLGCLLLVGLAQVWLVGCGGDGGGSDSGAIKIGFLVKQPEESWFRAEWRYAQEAADEKGFELIKIGAKDAEEVRSQIDSLAVSGAQGFVICTPDVRMGPAIKRLAEQNDLKFMTVDDQLVDAEGAFMTEVPHLGIAAKEIGRQVGKALYVEMQNRGWAVEDTAACVVVFKDLDTARERTDGAMEALIEAGFPVEKVYQAPQKKDETDEAFNATNDLLTNHPEVRNWLVCGMNDLTVIGAVRAFSSKGIGKDRVIAIGINGTDVQDELGKDNAFFGSMLLQPRLHGYDTVSMVYDWIQSGVAPKADTRTTAILITRDNYEQELKRQGLWRE